MSEKQNDIELRSEKIRGVIGRIPNILVRIGISVISITVLCLLLILFFLPYPTYTEEQIDLYSEPNYYIKYELTNGTIFYDSIKSVKEGGEIYKFIQYPDTIISVSPIEGNISFLCANNTIITKGIATCKITPSKVDNVFGIIYVPPKKIGYFHIGKQIDVFINNQSKIGYIEEIFPVSQIDHFHCIKVNINIDCDKSDFVKRMPTTGQAKILVTNKPFLKRILNL